jgi:hypothetical protein
MQSVRDVVNMRISICEKNASDIPDYHWKERKMRAPKPLLQRQVVVPSLPAPPFHVLFICVIVLLACSESLTSKCLLVSLLDLDVTALQL